jgi:hypothetical protein
MPRQNSADQGRHAESLSRGHKLIHGPLVRREPGAGIIRLVEATRDQGAAVASMFIGQVLPLAGADDVGSGIMSEQQDAKISRGRQV